VRDHWNESGDSHRRSNGQRPDDAGIGECRHGAGRADIGLEKSDNGCRLTFVVNNGFPNTLTRAAFEIAMFNAQGVVDRLTVLEFKDLPAGKTKVTRFNLAGADCSNIGRILINEVTDCTGEGVDTTTCRSALKTSSRTDSVPFGL
jgi:hypothetical protein